jgi:HTH-type transcriptional regulator, quorum sensing regulator NprR
MMQLDLQIEEKCKEWYDMLFDRYDKRVMTEKYEELQQLMYRNINNQTLCLKFIKFVIMSFYVTWKSITENK